MRFAFFSSWILLLLFFGHGFLQAQRTGNTEYEVHFAPVKGIYRFLSFTEGVVIFRNGTVTAARMNYNISFDEMHFIDQQGDTLSVAAPAGIDFISLNGSRFYYDRGFIQVIDNFNGILLGFKQLLYAQQEKKQGYEGLDLHKEISADQFFTGNGQKFLLAENETVRVYGREHYFFGDTAGHFVPTGKAYLYGQFPRHRSAIGQFLKKHKSNFNRLDDLLELLAFCRQLK